MAERKIHYTSNGGTIHRTLIVDDETPHLVHQYTEVDMTQVVENNKVMRELHPQRSTNKLVARGVPVTVAEKAFREQWDESDWKKWLNDPDNAAFRVWPGRV